MSIFIFQKKEKRNIESNFNFQKESLIFSLPPTIINQRSRKRGINTEHIYTFKAIVETIIISPNEMFVIRPELHHFLFGQAWFYSTASVKWPGHTYRPRKILYSASNQTQRHFSPSFTPPSFIPLVRPDVARARLSVQIIHSSPGERPPPTIYSMF